jgi:hypothetical protein
MSDYRIPKGEYLAMERDAKRCKQLEQELETFRASEGRTLDWEAFIRECCHQLDAHDGDHMNEAIWMAVRDAKRYRWLRANGRRAIYTGDKDCPLAQGEMLDKAVDERMTFDQRERPVDGATSPIGRILDAAPTNTPRTCSTCKGGGEITNTYPDFFVDGMASIIDYPEVVECPDCKGTGEALWHHP